MDNELKYLHLHELQALLKETDKDASPEKIKAIQKYIDLGGYQFPIEVTGEYKIEISNSYFKNALYLLFIFGLLNSVLAIASSSYLAFIGLVVNGYALYSLITKNRNTEMVLNIVGFIYTCIALLTAYALFYSTFISTENVIKFIYNSFIAILIFYGVKNFLNIVEK